MNRYEMLRSKDEPDHAPVPVPAKRSRKSQDRGRSESEEYVVPEEASPRSTRRVGRSLVTFDSRYLMKNLNLAYSSESLDYEMLRLLKSRATLRVTFSDGSIEFISVKDNKPEERKIYFRCKREVVGYNGTYSEYRSQIGRLQLDRWHTYEEVTSWATESISFFYYLGLKRGLFHRFFGSWSQLYE